MQSNGHSNGRPQGEATTNPLKRDCGTTHKKQTKNYIRIRMTRIHDVQLPHKVSCCISVWGRHAICTILFYLYMYTYKNLFHCLSTSLPLSPLLPFFLVTERASSGFMSLQMPTMWRDATSWPFVAAQPLQSPQRGRRSLPIITGSEQRGFWLPSSCWPECLSHLLHRSKVYPIYSCSFKPLQCSVDGDQACRTQPWSHEEHSHPRTQTCFPCRCRSPSLWAERREEGGGGWASGCLVTESLACACMLGLTPFVERATKCFATAALCEKTKEAPLMTFKWDKPTSCCRKLTSFACSRNQALADSALVMVSWVVKVFQWQN